MWISGRRYVDTRVGDLRDFHNSEVGALTSATGHLRDAIDKTQDELQRQVTELHTEGITREEWDAKHESLASQVKALQEWKANIVGRLVAVGFVYSVFLVFVTYYVTHNGNL